MEDSGDLKRRREAEENEILGELASSPLHEMSLPGAKRLRADELLFDILDEEGDAGEEQDLESVMRSLEEEIGLPSPPPIEHVPAPASADGEVVALEQPDLGYLFEASDDDLGLPPTAPSTSDDGGEVDVGEEAPETVEEGQGFGQIWGFEDEIHGFDEFEMCARSEGRTEAAAAVEAAAASFDGDLFDYPYVLSGLSDVAEFSWRSESLPAV